MKLTFPKGSSCGILIESIYFKVDLNVFLSFSRSGDSLSSQFALVSQSFYIINFAEIIMGATRPKGSNHFDIFDKIVRFDSLLTKK